MVEPVFASLRCRQGLNRFRRRGLKAVTCEFALHVLAYNLSKAIALLRALFFRVAARLRGFVTSQYGFWSMCLYFSGMRSDLK
jgi:hypothetical protein